MATNSHNTRLVKNKRIFHARRDNCIKQFPEEYTDDVNKLDMINREKYGIDFENWAIVLTVKGTGEKIVLSNYGPPEGNKK